MSRGQRGGGGRLRHAGVRLDRVGRVERVRGRRLRRDGLHEQDPRLRSTGKLHPETLFGTMSNKAKNRMLTF